MKPRAAEHAALRPGALIPDGPRPRPATFKVADHPQRQPWPNRKSWLDAKQLLLPGNSFCNGSSRIATA